MNRRDLFRITGGAVVASALPEVAYSSADAQAVPKREPGKQPNLLFLFTDEQRQDTLACYGNHQIKVPNLNRLASQSVVFHACYCTQPICTPSRATLLTGLWPHTAGEYTLNITLDKNIPVLVEMLPKDKYYTAYYGKWHLGNEIFRQHGFDEFESTEDFYTEYYTKATIEANPERTHSGYHRFLVSHGLKPGPDGKFSRKFSDSLPEKLSKPAYLTGKANSFIEKNREKPWVMYVNFLDPHPPFNSTLDRMYDPKEMKVPASFDEPTDPTELDSTRAVRAALEKGMKGYERYDGIIADDEAIRSAKARYWGQISLVDTMVGRIMAKLEETGQAENTIIVYTTDHGEMMGDHHLMFKSVMYEESVKVPMLLKFPGMMAAQNVQQPVSDIDVVPTLLDLMGEEIPSHLQGNSWACSLRKHEDPPKQDVIIEMNGGPWPFTNMPKEPLRTLRTNDGWKMTLAPEGEGEMYNLNVDPKEMHNVFYDSGSLKRIQRHAAEINLWQRSTGDKPILFDEAAWQKRRKDFIDKGVHLG